MKITREELEEATKAIVDLLKKKGHPHMKVIIEQDHIELVEGVIGIPVEVEKD